MSRAAAAPNYNVFMSKQQEGVFGGKKHPGGASGTGAGGGVGGWGKSNMITRFRFVYLNSAATISHFKLKHFTTVYKGYVIVLLIFNSDSIIFKFKKFSF
jgi:hypothetical protein